MKSLKAVILSISGIVCLLPGYLVFTKSNLIPPIPQFSSLFALIMEVCCFIVVALLIINREKFEKYPKKRIVWISIILLFLFVIAISLYSYYINELIAKDQFATIVLPLYHTKELDEKIRFYGSVFSYLKETDTITLNEFFEKHSSIRTSILCSKILLLSLFILSAISMVTNTIIVSLRISSFSNQNTSK
jgi:hypothetical protein